MDQLPQLGKRELICLLLFTCNYVVSVWRGFLFLWVLGMGYVISSPVQSTGRAIVVTLASALALALTLPLPLALPFPSRHF